MRGHDSLIRMRTTGQKPAMVEVRCEAPSAYRPVGGIVIEPEDRIERLDLRCVIGCFVMLTGVDDARVREAFAALQDHGAQRVIGHVIKPRANDVDLLEIMDTDGVMTWRKS